MTGDESSILHDNNAEHAVWLPGDAETPTQPKQKLHSRKHIPSVKWDAKGPIYYQVLSAGRTVSDSVYMDQFPKLADAVRENVRECPPPPVHALTSLRILSRKLQNLDGIQGPYSSMQCRVDAYLRLSLLGVVVGRLAFRIHEGCARVSKLSSG